MLIPKQPPHIIQ